MKFEGIAKKEQKSKTISVDVQTQTQDNKRKSKRLKTMAPMYNSGIQFEVEVECLIKRSIKALYGDHT